VRGALGTIVIIFVLMGFAHIQLPQRLAESRSVGFGMGGLTGLSGGLTGGFGATLAMYLLACRLEKDRFVWAIGVLMFMGVIVLTISLIQAGSFRVDQLAGTLAVLVPSWIGLTVGGYVRKMSLAPSSEGPPVQLAEFQQEIRRALGTSATQVVDSREMDLTPEIRALRIVVAGQVSEVPIQWIYYHLTHSSGRRVSCVFTMSAEELERFGGEDLEIAGSILFLDPGPNAEATAEVSADSAVQR